MNGTAGDVLRAIRSGQLDNSLDALTVAIRERRQRAGKHTIAELTVGQDVRIKGIGTGAKYLNGALARVVSVGHSRVLVQITNMDHDPMAGMSFSRNPVRRFRTGTRVYLHGENLEPAYVDASAEEVDERHPLQLLGAIDVTPPDGEEVD